MMVIDWKAAPARRLLVLVCLALLALLAFSAYRLVITRRYRQVTLGNFAWGPARGEFGLATGTDGRVYGPVSFAVNGNGNIIIADAYNFRLQVIDARGKITALIPIAGPAPRLLRGPASAAPVGGPGVEDLAVDARGYIYLAIGGQINVYDPAGKPGRVIDLAPPAEMGTVAALDLHRVLGLAPSGHGGVYVLDSYATARGLYTCLREVTSAGETRMATVRHYQPGATPAPPPAPQRRPGRGPEQPVVAHPATEYDGLSASADGSVWLLSPGHDAFERLLTRLSARGEEMGSFALHSQSAIRSAQLVGEDGAGRLVVGLNLDGKDGRLVLVSPHRRVEQVVPLPGTGQVTLGVYARPGRKGEFLHLLPDQAGLTVVHLVPWRAFGLGKRGGETKDVTIGP